MSQKKRVGLMIALALVVLLMLYGLGLLRVSLEKHSGVQQMGTYESLPADTSTEDPLKYMGEDFKVDENFHTNLPIVVLSMEKVPQDYKTFENGQEVVYEEVEPYVSGTIQVIDNGTYNNCLTDLPSYESSIEIKKRGHTSMFYYKPQYLFKTFYKDGTENKTEILGMGEGDSWVLNGSMADKSMLRNYLPYRIASEIGGNSMSPDSRFCEVLIEKDGEYEYQGVYLLMETVSRGESRVNIDKSRRKKSYTSYIIRRDRFTQYDPMLDTYGRLSGLSEEWIGVKYPSVANLTEEKKSFIEKDFSKIEKVLYSEDENEFKIYEKYIDVDSFVDYFLINEYFGNYDAGLHSTYMYKNSGDKLSIGPVWDFDQAMNNYFADEVEWESLAFQTQPLFKELVRDRHFVDLLKTRYSELERGALSEEHVFAVINEAVAYLRSAREREWYRWADSYYDASNADFRNYMLNPYVKDGVVIDRFNDDYEQEILNIRTYLHKHSQVMQQNLTELYDLCVFNSSLKNENELFLLIIIVLFLVPSVLINRKA